MPCPPNATACGPDPLAFKPPVPCAPGPDGALVCAPPPDCGGAAFGGAGGLGCAPPDFCKPNEEGKYLCKPPEDCRTGPDGRARCVAPASGAACVRHLEDVAASGAFLTCAPPPEHFCPPPPPGAPPRGDNCRAPPPPPRFCAPGEAQFKADHPTGAPADCLPPPRVENGSYVPPAMAMRPGDCQAPPPGAWPPARSPEPGKVWCPPAGFAPPPVAGEGFHAWLNFTHRNAPPGVVPMLNKLGQAWNQLNETAVADLHRAGTVHQVLAPPAFDGRAINGSFLQSRLDDKLALENFSVGGAGFFREARPTVQANASFSTVAGPAVVATAGHVVVETHNVPAGILAYKSAENGNFTVDLTPDAGYSVKRDGDLLLMEKGEWKGVLVGDAEVDANGAIRLDVNPGRPAFFMAVPPSGIEAETRLDIARGVAQGKVFAEVSLVERNDTLAQALTMYEDASVFAVDVLDSAPDKVELQVSGEGEGQAVVFTVDRATLATPLSEFNVTMDGELMRECATFDQLAASAPEGGCYTLAANETVVRVSVMPEHFSTHVIALGNVGTKAEEAAAPVDEALEGEGEEPAAEGSEGDAGEAPPATTPPAAAPETRADTPGPGVLGALVAVAAAGLALRGRRRKE